MGYANNQVRIGYKPKSQDIDACYELWRSSEHVVAGNALVVAIRPEDEGKAIDDIGDQLDLSSRREIIAYSDEFGTVISPTGGLYESDGDA